MAGLHLRLTTPAEFADGLAAVRAELGVPAAFPPEVEAAAETAAARGPAPVEGVPTDRRDAREVELVTPEGLSPYLRDEIARSVVDVGP